MEGHSFLKTRNYYLSMSAKIYKRTCIGYKDFEPVYDGPKQLVGEYATKAEAQDALKRIKNNSDPSFWYDESGRLKYNLRGDSRNSFRLVYTDKSKGEIEFWIAGR